MSNGDKPKKQPKAQTDSEKLKKLISTYVLILNNLSLKDQEDFMTNAEYNPAVNLWWQQKFAYEFSIQTSQETFGDWKGFYRYFKLHGIPNAIRKAQDKDAPYLDLMVDLGLLEDIETGSLILDADYSYLEACKSGALKIVTFLVQTESVALTSVVLHGLSSAASAGHEEIVDYLITALSIKQEIDNYTALIKAVQKNHRKVVEVLFKHGAKVSAQGYLPLKIAIEQDYTKMFLLLLKHLDDIEVDFQHGYLLKVACKRGNAVAIEALLFKGSDVNQDKGEPIYLLATKGHLDIVKTLINNYGADITLPRIAEALHAVSTDPDATIKLMSFINPG